MIFFKKKPPRSGHPTILDLIGAILPSSKILQILFWLRIRFAFFFLVTEYPPEFEWHRVLKINQRITRTHFSFFFIFILLNSNVYIIPFEPDLCDTHEPRRHIDCSNSDMMMCDIQCPNGAYWLINLIWRICTCIYLHVCLYIYNCACVCTQKFKSIIIGRKNRGGEVIVIHTDPITHLGKNIYIQLRNCSSMLSLKSEWLVLK